MKRVLTSWLPTACGKTQSDSQKAGVATGAGRTESPPGKGDERDEAAASQLASSTLPSRMPKTTHRRGMRRRREKQEEADHRS